MGPQTEDRRTGWQAGIFGKITAPYCIFSASGIYYRTLFPIRRGVAQWLSASALGAESRGFDPLHPDHFLDSPPTGPPVGFFVFGADFEVELAHLQCRRESSVFAFPSVFPMISRQILRRVEVVGFSIGEAKVGETHKKSDLLIFGIEKRDSPLVGKYVVIYSLSSH